MDKLSIDINNNMPISDIKVVLDALMAKEIRGLATDVDLETIDNLQAQLTDKDPSNMVPEEWLDMDEDEGRTARLQAADDAWNDEYSLWLANQLGIDKQ